MFDTPDRCEDMHLMTGCMGSHKWELVMPACQAFDLACALSGQIWTEYHDRGNQNPIFPNTLMSFLMQVAVMAEDVESSISHPPIPSPFDANRFLSAASSFHRFVNHERSNERFRFNTTPWAILRIATAIARWLNDYESSGAPYNEARKTAQEFLTIIRGHIHIIRGPRDLHEELTAYFDAHPAQN